MEAIDQFRSLVVDINEFTHYRDWKCVFALGQVGNQAPVQYLVTRVLPVGTAVTTNTRFSQITGEPELRPGIATFHFTFLVLLQ